MGNIRFGAPKELVLWLRNEFEVKAFVETGTNRAETTIWASTEFQKVITVEAFEPLYRQAVDRYGTVTNIHFLHGDSRYHIQKLIETLVEPAIFWLDAHWCGEHTFGKVDECPVLDELALLNSTKTPHIVLIDDARLFLAPPPAPHEASHWPDLSTICQLLADHESKRYIAVQDDVIIAVPDILRTRLVEFLRQRAAMNLASIPSRSWRERLRQILSKVA